MGFNLNYDVVIDQLNDDAVKFCVEHLYPLFNYRVIKKEDVRSIDLKEKFYPLVSYIDKKMKPVGKLGVTNYYVSLIKLYLMEFISCKKGSRPERYKQAAIEYINKYDDLETGITTVGDILMIYLSLFRSLGENIEIAKSRTVLDATFDLEESDAEIIKIIWKSNNLIPAGMYETKTDIFNRKIRVSSDYDIKQKRQFFYAVSILLLARSLQDRGVFSDCPNEEEAEEV